MSQLATRGDIARILKAMTPTRKSQFLKLLKARHPDAYKALIAPPRERKKAEAARCREQAGESRDPTLREGYLAKARTIEAELAASPLVIPPSSPVDVGEIIKAAVAERIGPLAAQIAEVKRRVAPAPPVRARSMGAKAAARADLVGDAARYRRLAIAATDPVLREGYLAKAQQADRQLHG